MTQLRRVRLIAAVTAMAVFLMTLGAFGTAFAAPEQTNLEKAILLVKQRITIPPEYTEFRSEFSDTDYNGASWSLTWDVKPTDNFKGFSGKSISVSISIDFHITSYYNSNFSYYNSNAVPKFPNLTIEDAKARGIAFVKKVAPELTEQLDFDNSFINNAGLTNSYYYMTIHRLVNGVRCDFNNVSVQLDANTGEVTSFYTNWDYKATFAPKDKFVAKDAALATFMKEYPLQLRYEMDEDAAVLSYFTTAGDTDYLDAATGKPITINEQSYYPYAMGGIGGATEANALDVNANNELTVNERESVEETKNMMSSEEAFDVLYKMSLAGLDDSFNEYVSSYYYKNDNYYTLNIYASSSGGKETNNQSSVSASFNANTKELIYLYVSDSSMYSQRETPKIDEEEAKKVADTFIDKYAQKYSKRVGEPKIANDYGLVLYYPQMDNGITFNNNGVRITVNDKGNIATYENSFYVGKLASTEGIISTDKAEKIFASDFGIELAYVMMNEKQPKSDSPAATSSVYPQPRGSNGNNFVLVYRANPMVRSIDAVTGKLNNNYYYYNSDIPKPNYNDIKGHKYEAAIKALANYNILYPEDTFRPDDIITQQELFAIMSNISGNYSYFFSGGWSNNKADFISNAYYELLLSNVIDKTGIDKEAEMTRQDAIVYLFKITRSLGMAADYPSVFTTSFKDKADINPENKAYIAMADVLKLCAAPDGNLKPNEKITRGETANIIYNFLNRE